MALKLKIFSLCLGVMVLMSGNYVAAEGSKVGVIDFQKILETSSAGKAAQAEINRQGQKMEADLKKRGEEIEAVERAFERETLVMNREKREERQREIRIMVNEYKTMQQNFMEDFQMLENRMINRIQKEVVDILQEIGKKEGFALIMERRTGGVVFTRESVDLTDKVIEAYNAWFAKNPS